MAGLFDHNGPPRTIPVSSECMRLLQTKTDKNHLLEVYE